MKKIFILIFLFLVYVLIAETNYQIKSAIYHTKGLTRIFVLKNRIPVNTKKVFDSEKKLLTYIADIEQQLTNQRVFQETKVSYSYGEIDENNIVPVYVEIDTVDTWNIVALPYPKYDSNSGFQLKFKVKDYNFLGSMQGLNADINYEIDQTGESDISISFNLDFRYPFNFFDYELNWFNDFQIDYPLTEKPYFKFSTGTDIQLPLSFGSILFGIEESIILNDRDGSRLFEDDSSYLRTKLYTRMPVNLCKIDNIGCIAWSPYTSLSFNCDYNGIQEKSLKGNTITFGHDLSLSRINWHGNFRKGFYAAIDNKITWNSYEKGNGTLSVGADVKAYYTTFDFLGITSRMSSFYNFYDSISNDQGSKLRGILDKRVATDTAVFFSLDVPIKLLHADFLEITGVRWTRFISFEMQFSPFFDFALTHDTNTNRYFSFQDGWYAGGIEFLFFPMKMRSIYFRASLGLDIQGIVQNNYDFKANAKRDGSDIKEIYIGIGLEY